MSDSDQNGPQRAPRVLMVSYSYTGQSRAMLAAAADEFRARGWEVVDADIEFTDTRYADRFSRFPMCRVWPDMLSVLPAQSRRATGSIAVPDTVRDGRYDLVCIGSPTWWSKASIPIRSFLTSDDARRVLAGTPFAVVVVCRDSWKGNLDEVRRLGQWQGGRYLGGIHVQYPGDQLRSMLSLTSYLGSGEYRESYLGIRIPPTNVGSRDLAASRDFAAGLIEQLAQERV